MNLNFMQDVHDWEIESLDSFLTLLYSMNPRSRATDSMVWTPSSRHGFAAKATTLLTSLTVKSLVHSPRKAFGR
jgi:hypothetical protein